MKRILSQLLTNQLFEQVIARSFPSCPRSTAHDLVTLLFLSYVCMTSGKLGIKTDTMASDGKRLFAHGVRTAWLILNKSCVSALVSKALSCRTTFQPLKDRWNRWHQIQLQFYLIIQGVFYFVFQHKCESSEQKTHSHDRSSWNKLDENTAH